jgi:alanine dehydrogenase
MHKERGERRDFLPSLVARVAAMGVEVLLERGAGEGMGLSEADYASGSPRVRFGSWAEAMAQDVVLVLRFPELDQLEALRQGSTLVSMIHFPTRPRRVRRLRALGVEAVSLDSLEDDDGRRLVENMRAVAWNGLEAAFDALERTWPPFWEPGRRPVRVTVLGAGQVGRHAVAAATRYGREERSLQARERGLSGVEVTNVVRDLAGDADYMRERLVATDVLVDASQRGDPARPVIPNAWVAWLPEHAVICDLAVDPYLLEVQPPTVRGVEGIPRGDLDQWVFAPDDPAWDRTVPAEVASQHRRTTVSCYSWPGVHPRECMEQYEVQLWPLLEKLLEVGGAAGLEVDRDDARLRALRRASLRAQRLPEDGEPTS